MIQAAEAVGDVVMCKTKHRVIPALVLGAESIAAYAFSRKEEVVALRCVVVNAAVLVVAMDKGVELAWGLRIGRKKTKHNFDPFSAQT